MLIPPFLFIEVKIMKRLGIVLAIALLSGNVAAQISTSANELPEETQQPLLVRQNLRRKVLITAAKVILSAQKLREKHKVSEVLFGVGDHLVHTADRVNHLDAFINLADLKLEVYEKATLPIEKLLEDELLVMPLYDDIHEIVIPLYHDIHGIVNLLDKLEGKKDIHKEQRLCGV